MLLRSRCAGRIGEAFCKFGYERLPEQAKKEVEDFINEMLQKTEASSSLKRKLGLMKGQAQMSPDFDAPLEDFVD